MQQSQRDMVMNSIMRDNQRDVTPIRPAVLELHPGHIHPSRQGWKGRLAYIESLMDQDKLAQARAEIRLMLDGDAAA